MPVIFFRKVILKDLDTLLRWRNDPETRKNSVQSDLIQRSEHEEWLKQTIQSVQKELYIAELEGTSIGSIRFDLNADHSWELSWTVAPEARGKELGTQMVSEAVRMKKARIISKVKSANVASQKIALKAGFRLIKSESGMMWYSFQNDV